MTINYNLYANAYEKTRNIEHKVYYMLEMLLDPNENDQILDFGCGNGNYISELHSRFPNLMLFGIDNSSEMVALAKKNCPYAQIASTSLNKHNFPNNINKVYCIDVIHHFPSLFNFFESISNYICEDCRMVISTESNEQLKEKYWNQYFPSLFSVDTRRFHTTKDIIKIGTGFGWKWISTHIIEEEKCEKIPDSLYSRVKEKTLSALHLLDDDEYNSGLTELEKDYRIKRIIEIKEGYTLITFKKGGNNV